VKEKRFSGAVEQKIMMADAMVAALRRPVRFQPVKADGAARAARMLAELI
jgi:hypothetical protein